MKPVKATLDGLGERARGGVNVGEVLTLFRAQARRTRSYFCRLNAFPNRMLLRMVPGRIQGCWDV